ncbi:MAG: ribbon-helix-helix domain-containing protein [Cyanobacteriota bacterium]
MNFPTVFRKPVRVTITLPHNTYLHLKNRSDEEGRSLSNLAAYLIETSLG